MPSNHRTLIHAVVFTLLALMTIGTDNAAGASRASAGPANSAAATTGPTTTHVSMSLEALDRGPLAPPSAPIAAPIVASPPPPPAVASVAAPPIAERPAPVMAATCPADWFCYPRLGLRGPIVPYADCSGKTDVGGSIRAFTCLSPLYLMGHAYTKFGSVTAWRAGDIVTAYGTTYTITGAVTARSCEPPPLPLATLSLQTSLSPSACGAVLIVQAR